MDLESGQMPEIPGAYGVRSPFGKNELWNSLSTVFRDASADHIKYLADDHREDNAFIGSIAFVYNVQPKDKHRIAQLPGLKIFPLHGTNPYQKPD